MIKKFIVILLSLIMAVGVEARTVRDVFASEPGEVFMLLPRTTRLDLLDYYDNNQKVFAKNNLGEGTQLVTVEDNFIEIRMSATRTVQLLMVPSKKDTLVAVIETFETPVKDSHIKFYDAQWNTVVNKQFKMPTLLDFLRKGVDKKTAAAQLQDLPFALIELAFEGDQHTTLVARHGLKKFLVAQEYAPYEKILEPALTYYLKGFQWKLSK